MPKYTKTNAAGKVSVNEAESFVDALGGRDPRTIANFGQILEDAEALVRSEHDVHSNAITKVRGAWYESLISLGAYSYAFENNTRLSLVNLPKISSFRVHKLYKAEIAQLIDELSGAVHSAADVSLISSNPDFAIVRKDLVNPYPTIGYDLAGVKRVNGMYSDFAGRCELDDVVGYASAKTSLKPDRRLQIPHEGSLMKALYRHIQTRQWLIGANGIKYFGLTMSFGPADEKALKTVATHSIVDVLGKPESAVDKLYGISSGAELEQFLAEILH